MTILISDSHLWELLQSDENDTLDFKSSDLLTSPDGQSRYTIAKHIVGFANHQGGKLVFGVDDEGNPEGVDLVEEECLRTISEVISVKCSPTVNFSYDYYSSSQGDLSEGSVLVLEIEEKSRAPPVAIIENSDGQIRKREYRIRSGESTRLVPNGELVALFNQETDLTEEKSSYIWYSMSEDLSIADIEPKPTYMLNIDVINSQLVRDTDTLLEELNFPGGGSDHVDYFSFLERLLIYTLMSELYVMNADFFLDNMGEKLGDGEMGYDFEVREKFEGDGPSEMSWEPDGVSISSIVDNRRDRVDVGDNKKGFVIPENGKIDLNDDFSTISISVNDQFEIEISLEPYQTMTGLPREHPESDHDMVHGYSTSKSDIISGRFRISVNVEYNYPSQNHEQYTTSAAYYEALSERITQRYNWENYTEDLPDKMFYVLQEKIEDLENKIDEL